MPIGDLISASDYNTIRNKIINVMSTGVSNSGYGQTTFSTAVSAGNTVTKTQWDSLRFDIYNALLHQTGAAPSIVTIPTSGVISYGAGHPNTQYDTLADQTVSNRFDLGSGQFVTQVIGSESFTNSWYQSLSTTVTVTFNTAEDARFFFNSGGKIRFTSSRSGGTGTAQNTAWSNLLSSVGTQLFAGNSPGINFFSLTTAYQTSFNLTASSPYSANIWRIEALCNVANNSAGTANIITFRVSWLDGYFDPGPEPSPAPGDLVDGTLTLSVDAVRASGNLIPSGSFTVADYATATVNPITGS
jgi:hypothetical protein